THIHNNIFGVGAAAVHLGDANGGAGADYNRIEHNTFLVGGLLFNSAEERGDPFPGVQGNIVTNNIFGGALEVLRYTSKANTNILGKNLYLSSSSITSHNNLLKPTNDSLYGVPSYVGGASPTAISGFKLASGSVGK